MLLFNKSKSCIEKIKMLLLNPMQYYIIWDKNKVTEDLFHKLFHKLFLLYWISLKAHLEWNIFSFKNLTFNSFQYKATFRNLLLK